MFRFNRYFTKMIVFTIGASTLPIILLGLFFYMKTSGTIQQKVNDGNMLVLEQTRLRVEQVLGALDLQIERLSDNPYVTEALDSGLAPSGFILVQNVLKSMSQVLTFDVGIRDVHLIDLNRGTILNSGGLNRLSDAESSKVAEYLRMNRTKFWVAERNSMLRGRSGDNNFTINLVKIFPPFTEKPGGMLIIEIPAAQLRNFLAKNNTLGEVMIMDESYHVLASQNQRMEANSQMLEAVADKLHGTSGESGLYETSFGEEQVGVAFQRSAFNGWAYISVIPIDLIRFESRRTGWIILATCVVMLLAAVIVSLAGSQRMYMPVLRLYQSLFAQQGKVSGRIDEFHMIHEGFARMRSDQVQMADQLRNHARQLEEYYVMKLVRGEMKPTQLGEKMSFFDAGAQKWKHLAAIAIHIDTLEGTRYSERDSELLLFAVSNMVGELIPKHARLLPVVVDASQVTVIFDDPESPDDFRTYLYSLAKRVQDEVEHYLSLRVSIGISRPYDGLAEANRAYKEAMDALKYRVLYGQKTILRIDDVQPAQSVATQYPKELERHIFDAIKMADREKVQQLTDAFFGEISGQFHNYNDYQIAMTRFFVNLIRLLQESGISHLKPLGCDPPLLEQLHALSSVEETRSWFKQRIVDPMVSVFEEQRKSRHRTISQEVVQMIEDNYDTDISLESCSNLLNYHPSYISKVLRQELGISFSDYLMQYRLGKAKRMLEETDMKISEIAERLRYNNSQNFIRSFRKQEGMTPGQYRDEYINKHYKKALKS
ncbi:helix-turn-helix domain-containing protein [Paenibacillus thalictri]|uniref:AraC family transcriptional regulator n=1 Tax=Paenibacillus thalictri TaxID=2527873 RepID=A0A4Q9DFP0_9BACL|nr:helix-turn-helix domain-containing protein [Paenibacillus thalictri]TBL69692.1 AraC family transcriptional regulator [Paenibacillus thalictri]